MKPLYGAYGKTLNLAQMEAMFMSETISGEKTVSQLAHIKEYTIMSMPSIDALLTKQWSGKRSFESSLMECSVAFELLFRTPLKQYEDNEKLIRDLSLNFNRPRAKQRPLHYLSLVGTYEPMKQRFILESVIVFAIMVGAQQIIINLYQSLTSEGLMNDTMMVIGEGRQSELTENQIVMFEQAVYDFKNDMEFSLFLQGICYCLPATIL